MRLKLTLLWLALFVNAACAEPIAVSTNPLGTQDFGPLHWRGGVVLKSDDKRFGGLSGLTMSEDCAQVLAVGDTGLWFRASLTYKDENLAGISDAEIAPILDSKGQPPRSKRRGDAEAVAAIGNGRYMVGFESVPRIGIYDIGKEGLKARFQLLRSPKAIAQGPGNGELESIGRFSEGPWQNNSLAISEHNLDEAGNIRGWLWKSSTIVAFSIKRQEDYSITDAAILPGGDVLILERSASFPPGMAIRRIEAFALAAGETIEPEHLFEGRAPFYAIDNMEGLAVCRRDGELRIAIVSDNNFNPLQRTLLLQFAYKP